MVNSKSGGQIVLDYQWGSQSCNVHLITVTINSVTQEECKVMKIDQVFTQHDSKYNASHGWCKIISYITKIWN